VYVAPAKEARMSLASPFAHYMSLFRGLCDTPLDFGQLKADLTAMLGRRNRDLQRSGCCLELPPAVHLRADPMIYAQYYLLAQGLAVTWDNPDISIWRGGAPVPPGPLEPGVEHEVRVRVWNASFTAPAVNLPVVLSFLSFGVGMPRTLLGVELIPVLGPKGAASNPAIAAFRWRTPDGPGHYCLQAFLFWPDDANPFNNLGQKNTDVARARSPARMSFPVRNEAGFRRPMDFEADGYEPPEPRPCPRETAPPRGAGRLAESEARWAAVRREQGYGQFPVGNGWRVAIEPRRIILAAGEQATIHVLAEPLEAAPARDEPPFALNIHAFAPGPDGRRALAGGVTFLIERGG
jgi:hypothetical protein